MRLSKKGVYGDSSNWVSQGLPMYAWRNRSSASVRVIYRRELELVVHLFEQPADELFG